MLTFQIKTTRSKLSFKLYLEYYFKSLNCAFNGVNAHQTFSKLAFFYLYVITNTEISQQIFGKNHG